ncbi:MAG: hypothetical protein KatS3mg115_2344 [Candidatus Poribacteria bacterium]|nr:MAG: hypothetical protein KatS3mg115_2344 [Candidatus Poribacteria bacterium]
MCGRLIRIGAEILCPIVGISLLASAAALEVKVRQNAQVVPRYEVFELTFEHEGEYENPFFDVTIEVIFYAPAGKSYRVGGFHYGSEEPPTIEVRQGPEGRREVIYRYAKQNLWKARFAPSETGTWHYEFVFRNDRGESASGTGTFRCIEGRAPQRGFVRVSPENPFRWVFDDGSPYFPVGLQECIGDYDGSGSVLDTASLEGPFRTDLRDPPPLPSGPMYVRGPSENPQNMDVYFRRYAQAGFNLFRFSQANCSYPLYDDLDHYRVHEAIMTDELLQLARGYGFRIFYGIFGFQAAFNDEPENAEGIQKVQRFIKYSVDRWGAYVDFWEFLNEQQAETAWYETMIPYLRSIDPYGHPITTSWERPELDGIDLSAPHWYQREDEHESDAITARRAQEWKRFGKPVIVGEQGNWVDPKKPRPLGVGGVWDIGSARRMRLRLWSALFHEIALIFWNTSYARDGHFMNIWLGPQEREYVRALQDFASRLDGAMRMVPVVVSNPNAVRAYGLASENRAGVYLHHFADHRSPIEGLRLTLEVPRAATAYWYDPATAKILGAFEVTKGRQSLEVPPFLVDLALLITPDGAPDIDGDGLPNDQDEDDDNDGVLDHQDAFPLDPSEWEDADGDLIGDRMDADDDADGIGDDHNGNGTPDYRELDFDGDGIPRAESVPWDAFPWDPTEWRDTDQDGIGDNTDSDDDGDGWTDLEEQRAGTDPLNRLQFPPSLEGN